MEIGARLQLQCGARLAPFDIKELRDLTSYDELGLDMLGDEKTALFVIISDTDIYIFWSVFNFLTSSTERPTNSAIFSSVQLHCIYGLYTDV